MTSISDLNLSEDLQEIIKREKVETIEELVGLLGSPFKAKLRYDQIEELYDALRKGGII